MPAVPPAATPGEFLRDELAARPALTRLAAGAVPRGHFWFREVSRRNLAPR
ncbi:hypothetical protein [Hymenobacter fodinae]|uniref:hypothetical protein n=1 Tax=Hymenobacter fodinae TaxID=2510796 RepID=UPI0014367515|nr:hypothetical protein [Hymenobacter fodinae]